MNKHKPFLHCHYCFLTSYPNKHCVVVVVVVVDDTAEEDSHCHQTKERKGGQGASEKERNACKRSEEMQKEWDEMMKQGGCNRNTMKE